MTKALQIRDDIRLAGGVIRYHTWPTLQKQTIDAHSWNVLRILLAIWPTAPASVTYHIVIHDVGEIGSGDAPYPVKKDNPVLAKEMGRIEGESQSELLDNWMLNQAPFLTDEEKWAFKLAEFIEMWEFGLQERMLGNQFAQLIVERCYDAIIERIAPIMEEPTDLLFDSEFSSTKMLIARRAEIYVVKRKSLWDRQ